MPVKTLNKINITGVTNFQRKIIKMIKITREYFSKNLCSLNDLFPSKEKRIFEPSSGGIGIRLNIAKTILTKTITPASGTMDSGINEKYPDSRIIIPKNIAITRFTRTPAEATQRFAIRFLSALKLSGLYGTGLAQPIKKGAWINIKNSGSIIEPYKSRCFIGFKVKRPSNSAVWSP